MLTDLVKSQHLNALEAIENRLNEEAAIAVTEMIKEIDHRIDGVWIAMGTWHIKGEEVQGEWDDCDWFEDLHDVVEMCMYGFQGVRANLSESDIQKLSDLGDFMEWCLKQGACFEVTSASYRNQGGNYA